MEYNMSLEILLISIVWFASDLAVNLSIIFPTPFGNYNDLKWFSFGIIAARCLFSSIISSVKNLYDSYVID